MSVWILLFSIILCRFVFSGNIYIYIYNDPPLCNYKIMKLT